MESQRVYKIENKETVQKSKRNAFKKRIKNDVEFKLRKNISRKISLILKMNNSSKLGKSIIKYLPYSFEQLKFHLESLFEPWMTWKNRGSYSIETWDDNDSSTWTWQIDHIVPQYKLPYSSMEDDNFKICWNLSNLRPYSAKQNLMDGVNKVR